MSDDAIPDFFCVARWASGGRGHRQGDFCGDTVFRRLADADLCTHHYWRAYDRVLTLERREHRQLDAELYGSRTWEPDAAEVVYYLRRVSDGLIKIGTSSIFRARLSGLRGEHGALQLLLTHRGDRDREYQMHRKFARLRVAHTEFFRPGKPLLTFIVNVRRRQHAEHVLRGTVPMAELLAIAERPGKGVIK